MKLINTFGAVDYELAQHNYEIVEDNYDTQVIKLKGQYPFGIQMFVIMFIIRIHYGK